MLGRELPLEGGNASGQVVMRGATVRKPWTASTLSVHRLLAHLREEVGDLVPEPRGRDAAGRQVLEFVPGTEAMAELPLSPDDVHRVGASIRRLHDAATRFRRSPADLWTTAMRRPGDEIIGHNDLAPWNLIRGTGRWVVIDWDGAGPTTRIADLAYAARAFAELDAEHDLDASIIRLHAILDGYRAGAAEREALTGAVIERAEAMRDLLRDSLASGAQPWATMAAGDHGTYWTEAAASARAGARRIRTGLLGPPR